MENADGLKPPTKAWGKLPAEEVESLADIMKQEMEQAHLTDALEEPAEHDSIMGPNFLPGSLDNEDCADDQMIAAILQHEFDRESDALLKLGEKQYNKTDKVALSFENYKTVPKVEESDSSGPDDENLEYQNYKIDKSYEKPIFGASGVIFKDGAYVSKHDKVLCGRNNTSKVLNFPPEFRTGDAAKMDIQLSNQVFNRLKQHSIAATKRHRRIHEKKEKSTAEQAVDSSTSLELYKLINTNYLKDVHGVVATGKEAVVFHSILMQEDESDDKHVAVKIYKTTLNEFKNRAQYVASDKRLHKSRQTLEVWAQREYFNLKRLAQAGVTCPTPLKVRAHLLVMDFIGNSDGQPAPILKDVRMTEGEWLAAFRQVKTAMIDMYNKCGLVHGDLSEFNILYWEDRIWIIDVAQAVEVHHQDCLFFLARDCKNIVEFFDRMGLRGLNVRRLFNEVGGFSCASDETFDSDVSILASRMQNDRSVVHRKKPADCALELDKCEDDSDCMPSNAAFPLLLSMETSAQSCCNRQYDYFILDFLERLDIYVKKKLELERHLKNCWYYLAQTRLFMGSMSRVSELQFDFRDQPASVTLEVSEEGDHFQLSRTPTEEMKHRALKRFGILVPHSLKLAQVLVLTAVQLICEIAGLQAKINALIRELDSFK